MQAPSPDAVLYKAPPAAERSSIERSDQALILIGAALLVLAFWYATRRRRAPNPDPARESRLDAEDDDDEQVGR